MNEAEAIELIEKADFGDDHPKKWIDLGCGSGLFSYALAKLLPRDSQIVMVDKVNQAPIKSPVGGVHLEFLQADFTRDVLSEDVFDGILMANSLHYVNDKKPFIQSLRRHLSKKGSMIIVEYDTKQSNPWIPYPVTFNQLKRLCIKGGFKSIRKVGERPSRYGQKNMYAAEVR